MKSRLLEHITKTMLVWKHWRMLLKTKNPSCGSVDWPEISNEHPCIQVHSIYNGHACLSRWHWGATRLCFHPRMGAVLASVLSWDAPHNPALGFELIYTFPVGSKSRRSWCMTQTSLWQWARSITLFLRHFSLLLEQIWKIQVSHFSSHWDVQNMSQW